MVDRAGTVRAQQAVAGPTGTWSQRKECGTSAPAGAGWKNHDGRQPNCSPTLSDRAFPFRERICRYFAHMASRKDWHLHRNGAGDHGADDARCADLPTERWLNVAGGPSANANVRGRQP
jgi:hypothetical protein